MPDAYANQYRQISQHAHVIVGMLPEGNWIQEHPHKRKAILLAKVQDEAVMVCIVSAQNLALPGNKQ